MKEDALNELAFQIRELDRKIESLLKLVERERYELSGEKVVKQKTGVESVMKNFFKRNSGLGINGLLDRKGADKSEAKPAEQRLIRPGKFQEVESICKELVVLLINQNIGMEQATKVFENGVTPDGKITCRDIADSLQG